MKTITGGTTTALLLMTLIACNSTYRLGNETFSIGINKEGNIETLLNAETGENYVASKTASPLMTLRKNGVMILPSAARVEKDMIFLDFSEAGAMAAVKAENKGSYFTFCLEEISDTSGIDLVVWGPIRTSIGMTIGETIGVVRDTTFALGIQSLNPKTLGGYPDNEDDSFTGYDIFATTSLVDVADSVHILYRGNTARPEPYGSSLNAYTRARHRERIVSSMQNDRYVAPAFSDGGLAGSKIALFGCRPELVTDVISSIELNEGLPHPTLDGVWAKKAPRAVSAYLIIDFTPGNYREAIELTKKAGLRYMYHGDPFRTWGHFELKNGMNREDLKRIVEDAEREGIRVGVHTLSNFITTNDAYVTPVPDRRLAKVGSTVLAAPLSASDTEIAIEDPAFFNQFKNNNLHALMIGRELITYDKVSLSEPWILTGCTRGAFGTAATAHLKGDTASKLADHAYKTFLTDNSLSPEVSGNIAELFNSTGLKQISFDGLEGNSSTGMGKYGELLFVKNWFDNLSPEIKNDYIMDASTPGHYFWHMFTRMNWGEPWYAGFRESQTEYRLLNQDYFRRNYIPCMLGWFSMNASTSIEDIEWMLARSAAFDAGYSLVTSLETVSKNGCSEEILAKIKEWEKARMSGAFTPGQKKKMENIRNEFTLIPSGENQWNLIQYEVRRFEHSYRELQPGQPLYTEFRFTNPYADQEAGFLLTVKDEAVSDIVIESDNNRKIVLPLVLRPGETLKYSGGGEAVLYSPSWHAIKTIKIDSTATILSNGEHILRLSCSFGGERKGTLKLELKTAGQPEIVKNGLQ